MSIRVIASVGVMLSVAMTSFSIYLGVVEHSYSPMKTREYSYTSRAGRESVCVQYRVSPSTASTLVAGSQKVVRCGDAAH